MSKWVALAPVLGVVLLWAGKGSIGSPKSISGPASPPLDEKNRGTPVDTNRHPEWQRVASGGGAKSGPAPGGGAEPGPTSQYGAACRQELTAMGMRFRKMPDREAPDAAGCGIPHGVIVTRGPLGITYEPPLVIDCSLARELPGIEKAIQEQAQIHLGSTITHVVTFGTYSCRKVRGGFTGRLSEHGVGNAIDLGGFRPRRGVLVSVSRHYRPLESSPDARGLFLRSLFRALRSHEGLTHVIGPETRADHHDHIHVDRGEPWWHFTGHWFGG